MVAQPQLIDLGLTPQAIYRRRLRGNLVALYRGVYAVGHVALTARSRDLAAVLACGPGAVLSHRSAGAMWSIRRTSSPRIEVTAPRGRKGPAGITVHRSRVIHSEDRAAVDAIAVTSVARTLVDLADVLSLGALKRAMNEAELLGLFDLAAVERTLERLPNRRGRGRLRRALQLYLPTAAFTRSKAERAFIRLWADHGLPQPSANLAIAGEEVDLIWTDARLIVEIDGTAVHGTTRAFHEDRRRDRALAARGYQVVRVTAPDLHDGAALAGEMKALRARRLAEHEHRNAMGSYGAA